MYALVHNMKPYVRCKLNMSMTIIHICFRKPVAPGKKEPMATNNEYETLRHITPARRTGSGSTARTMNITPISGEILSDPGYASLSVDRKLSMHDTDAVNQTSESEQPYT